MREKEQGPSKYAKYGEDLKETMRAYYDTVKGLHADKDANGKTITGSKKAKVVAEIEKIPGLTNAQRRELYLEQGYAESYCPW